MRLRLHKITVIPRGAPVDPPSRNQPAIGLTALVVDRGGNLRDQFYTIFSFNPFHLFAISSNKTWWFKHFANVFDQYLGWWIDQFFGMANLTTNQKHQQPENVSLKIQPVTLCHFGYSKAFPPQPLFQLAGLAHWKMVPCGRWYPIANQPNDQ